MKNIKRMFFVLALVTLLATVGAVCAADDADTTFATDTSVVMLQQLVILLVILQW